MGLFCPTWGKYPCRHFFLRPCPRCAFDRAGYKVRMPPQRVEVEVWSDIACPWCWVGKRHLEAAIAAFDGEVAVTWRAFELDPDAATASAAVDYVARLAAKYRRSRSEAQAMIDRMVEVGRANGLEFRFDRVLPTNTFDAHRLLSWAAESGRQDQLKERLFVAYMNEGRSVSDHAVLVDVAADAGLAVDMTRAILATNAHAEAVRSEERQAARMGVTGVPFFAIGERFAVAGAQPADLLLGAMRQACEAGELIHGENSPASCGPDGCAVGREVEPSP